MEIVFIVFCILFIIIVIAIILHLAFCNYGINMDAYHDACDEFYGGIVKKKDSGCND